MLITSEMYASDMCDNLVLETGFSILMMLRVLEWMMIGLHEAMSQNVS